MTGPVGSGPLKLSVPASMVPGMHVDWTVSEDGLGGWDPALVDQVVRRVSSPGYTEWWDRVQASGYCARPVHLVGVDGFGRPREVLGGARTAARRCARRVRISTPGTPGS